MIKSDWFLGWGEESTQGKEAQEFSDIFWGSMNPRPVLGNPLNASSFLRVGVVQS